MPSDSRQVHVPIIGQHVRCPHCTERYSRADDLLAHVTAQHRGQVRSWTDAAGQVDAAIEDLAKRLHVQVLDALVKVAAAKKTRCRDSHRPAITQHAQSCAIVSSAAGEISRAEPRGRRRRLAGNTRTGARR